MQSYIKIYWNERFLGIIVGFGLVGRGSSKKKWMERQEFFCKKTPKATYCFGSLLNVLFMPIYSFYPIELLRFFFLC